MPESVLPFTREEMARAEARDGYSQHPVIVTIDKFLPQIALLNQGINSFGNPQERGPFIKANYGFFADALVEAGPYTLKPLEIVAIWSRVGEVFSGHESYGLVRMITSAYIIQEAAMPVWRKFPRYQLEKNTLPEEVIKDQISIKNALLRMKDISMSLNELQDYVSGGVKDVMSIIFELTQRIRDGDQEAQTELDRVIKFSKENQTPLLSRIGENWGNGCSHVGLLLQNALEDTQE